MLKLHVFWGQGEFLEQITIIRERMLLKEKEIHGKWMTEERLKSSGDYSKHPVDIYLISHIEQTR